jgi:hypothetical protein
VISFEPLLQIQKSLLKFGRFDCSNKGFDQLREFSSLTCSKLALSHCRQQSRNGLACIADRMQFRHHEMNWSLSPRRQYSIYADAQSGQIAMFRFRDHFPDQFPGFTVEKLLSKHSGRVSSTRRTPFRIPAAALWHAAPARVTASQAGACLRFLRTYFKVLVHGVCQILMPLTREAECFGSLS